MNNLHNQRIGDDDMVTRKVKLIADITARMGFPMVICLAMLYMQFITIKEQTKALEDLKETLVKMSDSIAENTTAIKHTASAFRHREE